VSRSLPRRSAPRTGFCLAVAIGALFILPAQAECRNVNGHFTEQALGPPACNSPVGVCTQGTYSGALHGNIVTVVSSFSATADTPVTAASVFTADSTLTTRIGRRDGTLLIKNAGALRSSGAGEIVDLQTIVGGTDGLAGASGVIQAFGAFTFAAGGRSEYVGVVCLP
jgi:hypothetical protein